MRAGPGGRRRRPGLAGPGGGQEVRRHGGAGDAAGDGGVAGPDEGHDLVGQEEGGVDVRGVAEMADEGEALATCEAAAAGAEGDGPGDDVWVQGGVGAAEEGGLDGGVGDHGVGPGGGGEFLAADQVRGVFQLRAVFHGGLAGEAEVVEVGHGVEDAGAGLVLADEGHVGQGGGDAVEVDEVEPVGLGAEQLLDGAEPGGVAAGDAEGFQGFGALGGHVGRGRRRPRSPGA